jgi:biotin carboxylase
MPNLLFLGTPPDAIPSFGRALSLGYGIYAVDGNPASKGLAWVRRYGLDAAVADVFDTEAILAEVSRNNWSISGVMAIAVDCGDIVSAVAKNLNLPYIPVEISRLSRDKVALKDCLRAAGIPVPPTADFVVKPQDGRGSRGVSIISASNIAQDSYREAYLASRTGRVMFEQFIPGAGVSAEAVIWGGRVIFCGLTDRHYHNPLDVVEYGGNGPSRWEGKPEGDACHWLVQRTIEVLGIQNGSAKFDIILDENNNYRPVILELAVGRIGGGNNPFYLSISYNVDVIALLVAVYTGQDPTPHLAPFRASWGASGRHVAGRYRSNGSLTKNADRGRFKMGLGRSREEAERKAGG